MRIALSLALALFLLPAGACGGDDDDDTGDDQADGIDAAGGTDVDAGEDDGGDEADAAPEVDAGPVHLCGGIGGLECNDGEYCNYEDDSCGNNDTSGICVARPTECEPDERTVCGCDGEPYDSKCLAAEAGTDVAEIGLCK